MSDIRENSTEKDCNEQLYEEMLFRLMANKYVAHENERLEKMVEEAEETPEQEVDIEKIYKREEYKKGKAKRQVRLYRAGSILMIVFAAMIASFVTMPTVRAAVFDFFYKVEKDHTDVSAEQEGYVYSAKDETGERNPFHIRLEKEYEITYLPKGFFITLDHKDAVGIDREYTDSNDNLIMYSQTAEETAMSLDTENADVKNIDINGKTAMMTVKKEKQSSTIGIVWKMNSCFISITFLNVNEEEALKVARSVK